MTTTTTTNVANSKCTADKLEAFSDDHCTYINQFFGDITVRDIIHEIYPSQHKYDFAVEPTDDDGQHHFLQHGTRKICSVDLGIQTMGTIYSNKQDKNDNLCQSYSLLLFMDQPVPKVESTDTLEEELFKKKSRQMQMIRMYRDILKKEEFNRELNEVTRGMQRLMKKYPREKLPAEHENGVWMDYTREPIKEGVHPYMNLKKLMVNVRKTLDDWEDFGYWYFIRKGTCPPISNTSTPKSATLKRKRTPTTTTTTPHPRGTRSETAASQGRTRSQRNKST